MNKKLVWKCTLCIRLPVLKVLVCISLFCICLEILCVKFFLYLWNLQEKNACENYHWHLLFFYFLTMSNYQWIYGVSNKTQLLVFFYRLHKMLQIFKMFKNQSKQTKINKGPKKTGVWSTRLKWNFCVSLMASFNCLYNYCKIGQ